MEITSEVIPEHLLDLIGVLVDEWWGTGHCEDKLPIKVVVSPEQHLYLELIIAAYWYMFEKFGPEEKQIFNTCLAEFAAVAERKPCT